MASFLQQNVTGIEAGVKPHGGVPVTDSRAQCPLDGAAPRYFAAAKHAD